jgi:polar amino acid transport system substrate-binding protein
MAVRQGEFQLLHWLDTYIFFIKGNGELNRLHKTWLGEPMGDIPVL